MAEVKKHLLKFLKVFTQHPACVTNTILFTAVASIEQTFEGLVFKCPEDVSYNWSYALASSIGPAVALWILGILGSNLAWRLCQGLRSRKAKSECGCFLPCFCNLLLVLFKTSIIPLVWILIVLFDGDMYVCYHWNPDDDKWNKYNKSFSQIIGWIYFGSCLLIGLIVVFLRRYFSDRTYLPHIYATERTRAERLNIEKLLKEMAEKDATPSSCALLMESDEQNAGIDNFSKLSAADWESICREKPKDKQFYTPAQEFLDQRKVAVAATKEGANNQDNTTKTEANNALEATPQEDNQNPTTVPSD